MRERKCGAKLPHLSHFALLSGPLSSPAEEAGEDAIYRKGFLHRED